MFGASEDRARQLAGRQRWNRVSSTGSATSYRSASSSSQLSQLSLFEASSIFEQSIKRLTPVPVPTMYGASIVQHGSARLESLAHDTAASDVEAALSQMMASNHHPRTQHQRSQAEYLSQVLYSDMTVKDVHLPSSNCLVLPSLNKKYGVLGWGAKLFKQSRHATEPATQSHAQDRQSTVSKMLETTNRSVSAAFTTAQPTVSMRGGGGYPVESFWHIATYHIYYDLPFNTGAAYRKLVDALSPANRDRFNELFVDSKDMSLELNLARQAFYLQNLDAEHRRYFWDAGFERAMELVGLTMTPGKDPPDDHLEQIRETSIEGDAYPEVTLERLAVTFIGGYSFMDGYYSGGGSGSSNPSAATKAALNKLFDKYREDAAGEPDLVGVDGTMSYLQQLEVDLEGLDSLAVLEVIQAPTMGEITREGFVNGWLQRDADTIDKQKAYITRLKGQLPAEKAVFTRVYKYTFFLAKTGQQKAVPLEAAVAYWDLLFDSPLSGVKWSTPNTPWLDWWKEFLEVSWKKSVNKDMWNETLKFAQLTLKDEAISFWNEESSWPSVIDDFVDWVKKEKRGGEEQQKTDEMEY